jgi:hypothetical protein
LSAAVLCAQPPIVVSGGGAALQQAIQAASPGDTLDVMPGQYDAVTCTRGIVIALRPGAEVGTSLATSPPAVSILSVPVGERLVVKGGRVGSVGRGFAVTGCAGSVVIADVDVYWGVPIAVTNCTGPVTFDGVYRSNSGSYTHGPATVASSTQVSFHGCALPILTVNNAHVAVDGGDLVPYGDTPGVELHSGSLGVTGTRIVGAQLPGWPVTAAGIRVHGGELTLTGGAIVEATYGAVVLGTHPAIATTGGSIRIDPGVTLVGLPTTGPATVRTAPLPSRAGSPAGH